MMTLGLQRSVLLLLCVASVLLSGCVSQGKYDDLEGKYTDLQGQYNELQGQYNNCRANISSCSRRLRPRRRKVPRKLPP